ncbi:MAG: tRNA threonylcarbamoyladenosine dehydratase [Verrucomicrobiae bacterium]|nr:tRNA threonylcarbamoyladenosine dehydratase [Verrucomicrobiae bacterium]
MSDHPVRFGGVARLYGEAALERLRHLHILVVGLGGVGSWSVEALARSGVGALTLVDLDDICVSNVNRQLPAMDGTIGLPKGEVLASRVRAINPECRVTPILDFFTPDSASRILEPLSGTAPLGGVLDAIDPVSDKCALIAGARARGLPLVSCGAAGGRRDASQVRVGDLSEVTHDRLLRSVRRQLRRDHGFARSGRMGVDCVYSPESPVIPGAEARACPPALDDPPPGRRLNCNDGLGSSVFVTATFGMIGAGRLVERLLD